MVKLKKDNNQKAKVKKEKAQINHEKVELLKKKFNILRKSKPLRFRKSKKFSYEKFDSKKINQNRDVDINAI